MEPIIYEINNVSYLLIEVAQYDKNKNKIQECVKEYNCIYQGVKECKRESFWHYGYAILKILVPAQHAFHFNEFFK